MAGYADSTEKVYLNKDAWVEARVDDFEADDT